MIHLTISTKNQTFLLRDGWHLIFNGRVPHGAAWADRGGAEAQLSLLEAGYSTINEKGRIQHRRSKNNA